MPCFHTGWEVDSLNLNMNDRPLAEILEAPEYIDLIEKAIGPNGCHGWSTMCYNWDKEFQNKVMHPDGALKVKQKLALSKEYVRVNPERLVLDTHSYCDQRLLSHLQVRD